MEKKQSSQPFPSFTPSWKGNALIFSLLIFFVLLYFYWQIQQTKKTFRSHVQERSIVLASVIESYAHRAVLSQELIEEIIKTFLSNTTRFVDYLNAVEPFLSHELTAFAQEAGLAGIRITGPENRYVE